VLFLEVNQKIDVVPYAVFILDVAVERDSESVELFSRSVAHKANVSVVFVHFGAFLSEHGEVVDDDRENDVEAYEDDS